MPDVDSLNIYTNSTVHQHVLPPDLKRGSWEKKKETNNNNQAKTVNIVLQEY